MRYIVKYHANSSEWLVFDMGGNFELMGVYASEDLALQQAARLEETSTRRQRYSRTAMPLQEAA